MGSYDAEFLDQVMACFDELGEKSFWFRALIVLPVVAVAAALNLGWLFLLVFAAACALAGNVRAAGLLGWMAVTAVVLLYFLHPVQGHFIELLLRMPARGGTPRSSAQVIANLPQSLPAKVFLALAYGAFAGLLPGLGLGWAAAKRCAARMGEGC